MSFMFAVLLVLNGVPRTVLHDNTDRIATTEEDTSAMSFAEALESWNDDRLIGAHTSTALVTPSRCFPIASSVSYSVSDEVTTVKENSRIYKLNSIFRI